MSIGKATPQSVFGLSASALKDKVKPLNFRRGFQTLPGEEVYDILRFSLDNRDDRSWWPSEDPECFVCDQVQSEWNKKHNTWYPVFSGERWPWSYKKGFGFSPKSKVISAARYLVEYQINEVRVPGKHVHHVNRSFSELLKQWSSFWADDISQIEVVMGEKPGEASFAVSGLNLDWQIFHLQNAELEVLTKQEHALRHKGEN